MTIRVLLFASLREAVGQRALSLEVSERSTIAQVAKQLEATYPPLTLAGTLCAVNEQYQPPETVLNPGDTLAFLPPVSGG
jgi:molybdopterin synthase sulfur carrier subunit